MSFFVKTTPAPTPKTDRVKSIALLYAVILTAFALAQLYTFEEFTEFIISLNLPLGDAMVYALVPLLIVSEVFAIPFLLRMALSPAFRFLSLLLGWFAALLWLAISFWIVSTRQPVETVGFLGTVADLTPGWWAVLASLALVILAAWASWGMWPLKRTKK